MYKERGTHVVARAIIRKISCMYKLYVKAGDKNLDMRLVCTMASDLRQDEKLATARLIASAPVLLRMLELHHSAKDPHNARLYYQLADVLCDADDKEKARPYAKKALELHNRNRWPTRRLTNEQTKQLEDLLATPDGS